MAHKIFIRLPNGNFESAEISNQQVQWCISDGIGRPTVQQESLEAVLQTIGSRELVVLVPSDEIVLSEVDLPIRQRAKLLQAVPYALEEQLAEDVDKLHFALSDKKVNGKTPVFAVAHTRMKQWVTAFETAGVTPKAIVPDILCLPVPADDQHWTVLVEDNHALVRTSASQGFTCDSEALVDYLSLAEAGENLRLKIASVSPRSELALSALPVQNVDIDNSMRYGLEAMRLNADVTMFNLLQGPYALQSGYDDWWRPLRSTAALLLAAVMLATVTHAVDYFRLKAELNALDSANREAISRLFPEIKRLVPGNERIQLERRLTELRGSGNTNGLFLALSVLAESLQSVGSLSLQELQLRDNILFLNLVAKDIDTLERLKAHYQQKNEWELEVQSANSSSEGVQIRASLKGTST